MLYECSCGFTASSATAFYKHLAQSKESGAGHSLVQARFTPASDRNRDAADEYLVVEPVPAQSPAAAAAAHSRHVSVADVPPSPVAEPQGTPAGWSHGRQRSDAVASGRTEDAAAPVLSPDEVELQGLSSSIHWFAFAAPAHPVAAAAGGGHSPRPSGRWGGGSGGGGGDGPPASAAMRASSTLMAAMVMGLSPWRWFGAGGGAAVAPEPLGPPVPGAEAGDAGGARSMAAAEQVAAPALHGADRVPPPAVSLAAAADLTAVLTWQNPLRTGRVFGIGLYAAICVRQVAKGHDLLQPSTALMAACFLLLLRNVVQQALATYRRAQAAAEAGVSGGGGGSAQAPASEEELEAERVQAAVQLQVRTEAALRRGALAAARYMAALVVLGAHLLSGRRPIPSALVAALLWLGMVVGELRVMSQPTFWLLCYLAAFTIPAAYMRCRHALDARVEAALRFCVRLLVGGTRTALLSAAGVAGALLLAAPLNLILRASIAAVAAFMVLLWYARADAARGAGGGGEAEGVPMSVGAEGEARGRLAGGYEPPPRVSASGGWHLHHD